MALILSIDTSGENAAICIAQDGNVIGEMSNSKQTDHAAWIHTAVKDLLAASAKTTGALDAIAVTSGPGSYTGLRVSMATAKGLCYVLNIPLITQSTLYLLAKTVKKNTTSVYTSPIIYCPMIDARRMEVFTALYDSALNELRPPAALILGEQSFRSELDTHSVIFCGNGSAKWQSICKHSNALFSNEVYGIADLAEVAEMKYHQQQFADLAYAEPLYVKNVYTGVK